mmetsp:Transcript_51911/g.118345  ORF Transcript_51911/g.118345 Transcript_51911/m.118345 type:complete len:221 (+) Transcript_51911:287-949(+)
MASSKLAMHSSTDFSLFHLPGSNFRQPPYRQMSMTSPRVVGACLKSIWERCSKDSSAGSRLLVRFANSPSGPNTLPSNGQARIRSRARIHSSPPPPSTLLRMSGIALLLTWQNLQHCTSHCKASRRLLEDSPDVNFCNVSKWLTSYMKVRTAQSITSSRGTVHFRQNILSSCSSLESASFRCLSSTVAFAASSLYCWISAQMPAMPVLCTVAAMTATQTA